VKAYGRAFCTSGQGQITGLPWSVFGDDNGIATDAAYG
jgi:hypothetical protein